MNIPLGEPLTIVDYRDFHDVPRLMLVSDKNARFWVLDGPFDDSADEYSQDYAIFFAGHDLLESRRLFELWSSRPIGHRVGEIAVSRVRFDKTRRKELLCV